MMISLAKVQTRMTSKTSLYSISSRIILMGQVRRLRRKAILQRLLETIPIFIEQLGRLWNTMGSISKTILLLPMTGISLRCIEFMPIWLNPFQKISQGQCLWCNMGFLPLLKTSLLMEMIHQPFTLPEKGTMCGSEITERANTAENTLILILMIQKMPKNSLTSVSTRWVNMMHQLR